MAYTMVTVGGIVDTVTDHRDLKPVLTGDLKVTGTVTVGAVLSDGGVTARNTLAGQVKIGAFGPGSEAAIAFGQSADVVLYRSAADTLRTADLFIGAGGVQTLTKAGVPADGDFPATPADGSLAVNTTSHLLYIRSGGTWRVAGASIGAPVSGGTSGAVIYIDASGNLAQDTTNLKWDATNKRLSLATAIAVARLNLPEGTAAADGIAFGSDVTLYRSAADTLKTDDLLVALRFQSTVATGTAPMTVASTTAVANLNADLLDDVHGASFVRSDVADQVDGILTFAATPLLANNIALAAKTAGGVSRNIAVMNASDEVVYGHASHVLRFIGSGTGPTYNGNAVWHAGNDGAGSGLDADLLDGQHASAFALAGHIHDDRYYTESESDGRFARVATGSYTGDGTASNRQISVAFRPRLVMLRVGNSGNNAEFFDPLGNGTSWRAGSGTSHNSGQGSTSSVLIDGGGFRVGTAALINSGFSANDNGTVYEWVAYG